MYKKRKWGLSTLAFVRGDVDADVCAIGLNVEMLLRVKAEFGLLYLKPQEAVDFARWILDTFGEPEPTFSLVAFPEPVRHHEPSRVKGER